MRVAPGQTALMRTPWPKIVERGGAREADHAMLAGRISADAALADQSGDRSRIDDGAAARADHGRDLVLHGQEDALEVDVDQAAPGHLFFVGDRKSTGTNAGIVECHVKPPEGCERTLDHAATVGFAG